MSASGTIHAPLRYDPSDEQPREDEARIRQELMESMRSIQQTTLHDTGHAFRSVHAKSHAILEGEMEVLAGLPPELAQGLFAKPGTYPVVLRLSTIPGDMLDDAVSTPRGLAVKVIGVEGERLPGSEGDATQDFVLANAPAFAAPDPAAFARNLKLLAATTDTGQGWKKAFSATLRGAEAVVEALGGKSPTLVTMGGQPLTHPLGETFYSQVPIRYGDHVAKVSVAPASAEMRALKDRTIALDGRPNALREEVIAFFRRHAGVWELRVQLRTNAETMPVEDASVAWPEEESPYRTVARITVPPQPAWNEMRARRVDDGLAFSPWHGLLAHQPLGAVNRARRAAYRDAAEFRAKANRCPVHEPRAAVNLSRMAPQPYGTMPGREGRRPGTPDARPGHWGTPMESGMRHAVAGALGGLAAGLVTSAVMVGRQAVTGGPSDLGRLEHNAAARLGHPPHHRLEEADAAEELTAHAGHLALSALAGAAYGLATRRDDSSPVVSGLAFGVGFYALAFGIVGPALGVTRAPARQPASELALHGVMHAAFGLITAVATDRIARRM